MNFYQFLKTIQDKIGNDCRVSIRLWTPIGEFANGIEVHIDWENDFHYRFIVLEIQLDNFGLLEELAKHIIREADRKFRIAEVGEE